MAWVFIDTHERGFIRYGFVERAGTKLPRPKKGRAQDVLRLLAKDRFRLARAEGICVVAGPGSFSSVRTGVLYANLLARLLRKPLVSMTDTEMRSGVRSFATLKMTSYVPPIYDAEPNITTPRATS